MPRWTIEEIERLLKAEEKGIHQFVKYNYKEVIRSLIDEIKEIQKRYGVQEGGMKLKEAIKVLGRYAPCPHDNYDSRLGDGKTWGKCEDCGETFLTENLQRRRQSIKDFEDAMNCLHAINNTKT